MNRLDRDSLIKRALNILDNPALDAKNRPTGSVVSTAPMIEWLQDGLDHVLHLWPWGATVTKTTFTLAVDANTATQPSDFILDYKNGIRFVTTGSDKFRVHRRGLDRVLSLDPSRKGRPRYYVVRKTDILFWPKSDVSRDGELYYYALPATLGATDKPIFPSDWVLTEYLRLRGLEWVKAVPATTAMIYLNQYVADLQKSGLGTEQEAEDIELDPDYAPGMSRDEDPLAWLGEWPTSS